MTNEEADRLIDEHFKDTYSFEDVNVYFMGKKIDVKHATYKIIPGGLR
jgi:hypothetical protein